MITPSSSFRRSLLLLLASSSTFFLFFNAIPLATASLTNMGTDFWVSQMADSSTSSNFAITLVNPSSTTVASVTIDYPHSDSSESIEVAAGSSVDVEYSDRGITTTGYSVQTRPVYHVTSDIEIAVFTQSTGGQTTTDDGAVIFPTEALGTQYMLPTYSGTGMDSNEDDWGSFFGVTGTVDGTYVEAYNAAGVLQRSETIDAGEMWMRLLPDTSGTDFAGWQIVSDQPVAVSTGSRCRDVGPGGCDHMMAQVPPEATIDSNYIVCPMLDIPRDCSGTGCTPSVYRVLATQDSTSLTYSNSVRSSEALDRGAYSMFESSTPFMVTATEPIYISQVEYSEGEGDPAATTGDQAFTILTPISQYLTSYAFDMGHRFDYNSLIIAAPSGTVLTMDGDELLTMSCSGSEAGNYGGDDYCCYTHDMSGTDGYHTIEGTQPFAITIHMYELYVAQSFSGGGGLEIVNHNFINDPPVAVCTSSLEYSDSSSCYASPSESNLIEAIGSSSTDADGDALSFSLSDTGPFEIGTTTVTLNVSDGEFWDSCEAEVVVVGVDADNDDEPDCTDECPNDPLKTAPLVCGCGTVDDDSDADDVPDCFDFCPNDDTKYYPEVCGCSENEQDSDSDGVPDCTDECPSDENKTAALICGCGESDEDSDDDGWPDCIDECPLDANKTLSQICGCGVAETDSDEDGIPDCLDLCPSDPDKFAPLICGCHTNETDSDNDGVPDCIDLCPADPDKFAPLHCGCNVTEVDSDSDGLPDCLDECPEDPDKTSSGTCGCGTSDVDSDLDGTADCFDECPLDFNKTSPETCGCGESEIDVDNDGVPDCVDDCTSSGGCDDDDDGGLWVRCMALF